jgi:glycosyltransferase involved in cell wall biosynthesis
MSFARHAGSRLRYARMARVLHLLPLDGDLQYRRSLAALRAAPGSCEITTRTIGRGGDYGNLFWAVIGLRKLANPFDAVHAWDERSLVAATLSGMSKVIFTAPPSLSRRGPAIVRRAAKHIELHVVASTSAQRRTLIALGIMPDRCHLIHPPAELAHTNGVAREAMRKLLDIGEEDYVILASGESTRAAEHERAVWTGSILHVVDERYRVLLWGRGDRIDIAAGLGKKLRQPALVIAAEQSLRKTIEFEDLLGAADAMLVSARTPASILPVALAMKSGVPVVSGESPHLAEMLTDDATALTVPDSKPRPLAQRILDLRTDVQRRHTITANAKTRADELFAPSRFIQQYHSLYECNA